MYATHLLIFHLNYYQTWILHHFPGTSTGSVLKTTLRIFYVHARLSHSGIILYTYFLLITSSWMIYVSHHIMRTIKHDSQRRYPSTLDVSPAGIDLCSCLYLNEYFDGYGISSVYLGTALAIILHKDIDAIFANHNEHLVPKNVRSV